MAGVRKFDERKVVEVVLDVFWHKGWQGTSLAELAEATGVQRGSLYHAYGGKDELFLLAFDVYAARILADVSKALDASHADAALRGFFDFAIKNMSHGNPPRGCLTTKTATDSDAVGPRIQERLRDFLDALGSTVGAALSKESIRAGLRVEPDEATDILVTFTRGLAVMERIYHEPARLRRTADGLVRMMVLAEQ